MAQARFLLVLAAISAGAIARVPAEPPARPMSATDFATAAAQSDQYELLAARIALIASADPMVRAFARRMMADHAATSQSLRQAAVRSGLAPRPMALGADQAHLLGALQSVTGAAFDKAYGRQQVLAHQQAIVVEQHYAASGADPNLRAAAAAAVPMIQRHLDAARQIAATAGAN